MDTEIGEDLRSIAEVQAVYRKGYRIELSTVDGAECQPELDARQNDSGQWAGKVSVNWRTGSDIAEVIGLSVPTAHQRRGIASALVICGARLSGKPKLLARNISHDAWPVLMKLQPVLQRLGVELVIPGRERQRRAALG